jgi:hypothetical protein
MIFRRCIGIHTCRTTDYPVFIFHYIYNGMYVCEVRDFILHFVSQQMITLHVVTPKPPSTITTDQRHGVTFAPTSHPCAPPLGHVSLLLSSLHHATRPRYLFKATQRLSEKKRKTIVVDRYGLGSQSPLIGPAQLYPLPQSHAGAKPLPLRLLPPSRRRFDSPTPAPVPPPPEKPQPLSPPHPIEWRRREPHPDSSVSCRPSASPLRPSFMLCSSRRCCSNNARSVSLPLPCGAVLTSSRRPCRDWRASRLDRVPLRPQGTPDARLISLSVPPSVSLL